MIADDVLYQRSLVHRRPDVQDAVLNVRSAVNKTALIQDVISDHLKTPIRSAALAGDDVSK